MPTGSLNNKLVIQYVLLIDVLALTVDELLTFHKNEEKQLFSFWFIVYCFVIMLQRSRLACFQPETKQEMRYEITLNQLVSPGRFMAPSEA